MLKDSFKGINQIIVIKNSQHHYFHYEKNYGDLS